ncbi:alpha/beta fold hydrolase [Halosolutus halophilus]|uniref:alpha/beta fold hydrolase n=1 Tax=Halosolutus halophilus TaxID=1552990 RepID=UPI0022352FCF|nr:alpha/beta hydrolase [Halosolutus halophilus]
MPVSQCNGAGLYYEEYGEGRPIVFLHGVWAGLRFFESQLTGLSNDYRTIAVDFRGHGRSEKTHGGHTLSQYARDIRAFLERRELDDVVLAGWSMGALVSWEYVDQFGSDRVGALVNIDMEPAPFRWEDSEHGTYDAERLKEITTSIQTDHVSFIERIAEPVLKEPPSAEQRTLIFEELSRCPPPIKSTIITDTTICDYRDVLPEIDVPTLVCAGADEKWRSVPAVEYAADLVPNARFELFEESGHCLTIEEPDRFNRVLSDFVDSLR